jgi:hypothetical protein
MNHNSTDRASKAERAAGQVEQLLWFYGSTIGTLLLSFCPPFCRMLCNSTDFPTGGMNG